MNSAPFDPARVRAHRARAARAFERVLADRVAEDLAARVAGVNRSFGVSLAIGGAGAFADALRASPDAAARVGPLIEMDVEPGLLAAPFGVAADAEALPVAAQSLGLIVSLLTLHWANDVPGALIQARRALRPDGLFLAAFFGAGTLTELRECLLIAETEARGGAAMRVAPFADVVDGAGLLQRAGFALPVAESDTLTLRYREPLRLFADLRAMGETSALRAAHAPPLTRAILMRAMALYRDRFSDPDGRVRASFEILTLTGWAPHESQQKPLRPGSAKSRLADALGVTEISANEATPRQSPKS